MIHRLPAVLLVAVLALSGCLPEGRDDALAVRPSHAAPISFPRVASDYPWPRERGGYEPIAQRFPTPQGFARVDVADGGWAQWLRHLPLMPPGSAVLSESGSVIVPADSPHLAGVIDMDVRRNQECADVVLRLRAEYLRWAGRESEIAIPVGGGGEFSWPRWEEGTRARWDGERLVFRQVAEPDDSRACFEEFLDSVFAWCGTYSLAQMGERVEACEVRVGDFFAHGGSPGHAVLVADLARDEAGEMRGLLVQGYMPAQSAHVMRPKGGGAWFDLDPSAPVDTPFWGAFEWSELRRFEGRD